MSDPVVIVGAGLAGLTCAHHLRTQGYDVLVLESSDGVGGRVRTDELDGFRLDRGFQVLLTAYPEAQRELNYDALQLRRFEPGSLVQTESGRFRISDPWRRPARALEVALSPVGSLADKLRIARLRWRSQKGTTAEIFERSEQTTLEELHSLGFSDQMLERFLRPFLAGIFLDENLDTSSRMLYFVFRMFSRGDIAVPNDGMGRISDQLASRLPVEAVRLNSPVESLQDGEVVLQNGDRLGARAVVVATEQPAATRLLPELKSVRAAREVHCVYFAAPRSPLNDRMLLLNGTGHGMVNNVCVISDIAPGYAPDGQALVSISVLKAVDDVDELHERVRLELKTWFGDEVAAWRHLRTYHIPYALPDQSDPDTLTEAPNCRIRDGVYVCGDYRANGSINGALLSGRMAAAAVVNDAPH